MRKHGFRGRKTGPGIPIRTLRCKSHGQYFTVYPMGHVPYGRQPIVAVGLGGYPVDERKKEGVARWRDSGFEAAVDASEQWLWLREGMGEKAQPGGYGTQRRWIERSADVLGLSEAIKPPVVEEIVEQLGVSGLEHDEAREQYGLASGLVERGKAIVSVLNLIRFGDDLCARLMAAGTLSGCWGRVVLWDPRFNRRVSLLSRVDRASRSPPSV